MDVKKINQYIQTWKNRCYSDDIPDEVPDILMDKCLAPSYKAIALTILSNDKKMKLLGMTPEKSEWYDYFKKIELGIPFDTYKDDEQLEFDL